MERKFEFKPDKIHLNIDLVSHSARAEDLRKYLQALRDSSCNSCYTSLIKLSSVCDCTCVCLYPCAHQALAREIYRVHLNFVLRKFVAGGELVVSLRRNNCLASQYILLLDNAIVRLLFIDSTNIYPD